MIRKYLGKLSSSEKDKIKWRSHEPSRIEAFSDGVFALAVSLLVVSLETPHTSTELLDMMTGLIPVGVCFAVLFGLWNVQYTFFRRYGMHDKITISLNGILLFVVLCYIYPLKFLYSAQYLPEKYIFIASDKKAVGMLYVIGIGTTSLLFMLMYLNAWFKKQELKLTPIEIFETVTYIIRFASQVLFMLLLLLSFYYLPYFIAKGSALYKQTLTYGVLLLFAAALYLRRKRKIQFKKRFGNAPMIEPHLGVE